MALTPAEVLAKEYEKYLRDCALQRKQPSAARRKQFIADVIAVSPTRKLRCTCSMSYPAGGEPTTVHDAVVTPQPSAEPKTCICPAGWVQGYGRHRANCPVTDAVTPSPEPRMMDGLDSFPIVPMMELGTNKCVKCDHVMTSEEDLRTHRCVTEYRADRED